VFSFFVWGGFVFCAIWHAVSLLMLWADGEKKDTTLFALMTNIGLSGVCLCYFGMLAFK
jgi:hypothetical protein